ncbi:MAG TPA: hypothetical protein VGN12_16895 [Pirellulales bacterium]|jgi:hypothetical protein
MSVDSYERKTITNGQRRFVFVNRDSNRIFESDDWALGRRIAGSPQASRPNHRNDQPILEYETRVAGVRERLAFESALKASLIATHEKTEQDLAVPEKPKISRESLLETRDTPWRQKQLDAHDAYDAYRRSNADAAQAARDRSALAKEIAANISSDQHTVKLETELDDVSVDIHNHHKAIDAAVAAARENYSKVVADKASTQQQITDSYRAIWSAEKGETLDATPAAEAAESEGE